MKRVPLWLTIVPLVLGLAVYWHFWSGWRDTLRADLAAEMPGVPVVIGGFPYRMEADAAAPRWSLDGPLTVRLTARRARANRNPWQRDLTTVRTDAPAVTATTPLAGAMLRGTAATGASSVHLGKRGIARLSSVFTDFTATTGLFSAPVAAKTFEVHLRETRARSNEAWSVTPPQQAQAVLSGTGVRFGAGAPLTLDIDAGVTAIAALHDFAGWAAGGTVEVRHATLSDASGEVARLVASAAATGGVLRLSGTVETVCPATLAAAVAGTSPPRESRLRNAVRLSLSGTPGAFVLGPPPLNAPTATRAQEPPCPRLS